MIKTDGGQKDESLMPTVKLIWRVQIGLAKHSTILSTIGTADKQSNSGNY